MPSPSRNPFLRSELRPVTQPDGSQGFGHRLVRTTHDSDAILTDDGALTDTVEADREMAVHADRVAAAEERIRMMNAASSYQLATRTPAPVIVRTAPATGAAWVPPAPPTR